MPVSFFHFPLRKQDYIKKSSFPHQAQPLFKGKHETSSDIFSSSLLARQSVVIKGIIDTKSPGPMLIDFLKMSRYRATCVWVAIEANKVLPPNEQFEIGKRSTEESVKKILTTEAQKREGKKPVWLQYFLDDEDFSARSPEVRPQTQEVLKSLSTEEHLDLNVESDTLSSPPSKIITPQDLKEPEAKKLKLSVNSKHDLALKNIAANQKELDKLAAKQGCTTDELCQQLRADLSELAEKAAQTATDEETPQKRRAGYRSIASHLQEEDVQQLIQDMIGVSIGLKDSIPQFNARYKRTAFDSKKDTQKLTPLITYFNNQLGTKYGKLGAQRNWGNPEPQEHLEKFLEKYLGDFERSIDAFHKEFLEENHLTSEQFPIHRVYKYTEKNPNQLGLQGAGQLQPGSRRGPFIQYAESLKDPSCNTHYKLVARYLEDKEIDISWASAFRWTKWDAGKKRWLRTVDVIEAED